MSKMTHSQTYWIQLIDLCLIELRNWRWTWRSMLVISTFIPLVSMIIFSIYARDSGPTALSYVFSGNIVMSLMFGNLNDIQAHIVFMRFQGTLEYFATLPIKKHTLILAIIISFFILSLPSLLSILIIGSAVLQILLVVHPLILLVIPLCVVPMSAIGALIGVSVHNSQQGSSFSLLISFVFLGLGPVIIPPERLPDIFQLIGILNPAARASSALRQTLVGPVTEQIALDLFILLGFALCVFGFVARRIDWRVNSSM